MQAQPTDLFTLILAIPSWFWLAPMLFLLVFVLRFGSLFWRGSKADDVIFARNTDLSAEVAKLTSHKAQLIAWSSKAIRHFSGCGGASSPTKTQAVMT